MPEGDTLHRTAATLGAALTGELITAASARPWRSAPAIDAASLVGRRVSGVRAEGKNLLVELDDGRSVLTHLRMTGSWHLYQPGEKWWKPASRARLVIENARYVAVCFSAPVVELLTASAVRRHPGLTSLGPDILGDDFDAGAAAARFRAADDLTIGDALLRQQLVSGIGNVYKSEVLFAVRLDPWTKVRDLSDPALTAILGEVRTQMRKNLDGAPRRTVFEPRGERHWVYGRDRQPCLVCARPVEMRRQGDAGRSTYFCRACQKVTGG
ncbi:MAG: Fpg/Nei family DNA glycosylase [Deltaproteobacteria bacterium]|nr:Fpg/Nei family DNA glycosylase [Deltaproteobacteria bacterium]